LKFQKSKPIEIERIEISNLMSEIPFDVDAEIFQNSMLLKWMDTKKKLNKIDEKYILLGFGDTIHSLCLIKKLKGKCLKKLWEIHWLLISIWDIQIHKKKIINVTNLELKN
jgi:hypothetical protein